jgi:DNA polymerase-3 subunit epsilon
MNIEDDFSDMTAGIRLPPKENPITRKSLDFTVLDVEIAMPKWHTICQLAVCVVKDGKIQETRSWHIQPPGNEYGRIQSGIHGICARDTEGSKIFPEAWEEIKQFVDGQLIFCHNAQFDIGSLRQTFTHYSIEPPFLWYGCSWRLAQKLIPDLPKHKLNVICEHLGIPLKHHDAASDVRATAMFLLAIAQAYNLQHNDDYFKASRWEWGQMTPNTYLPHFERTNNRPSENTSGQHEGIILDDSKSEKVEQQLPDRLPEEKQVFRGLSLVFTGKFEVGTRDDVKYLAYILGAETPEKLTKTTDYLVVGTQVVSNLKSDGLSGKEREAKKWGIKILEEDGFFEMIESTRNILTASVN